MFGCLLAEELGIGTVVIPPHPGVLSALGLAAAPERVDAVASVHRPLEGLSAEQLDRWRDDLARTVRSELPDAEVQAFADCRFSGQGYEVMLPVPGGPVALRDAFITAHRQRYGHGHAEAPVELVALRAVAVRPAPALSFDAGSGGSAKSRAGLIGWRGATERAERRRLEGMKPGTVVRGPTVLDGADATALVAPGWEARVHRCGALIVKRI